METILIIGIIALLILLISGAIFLFRNRSNTEATALLLMQKQLDGMRQQFQETLSTTTQQINQQLATMGQQVQTSTGQMGNRLDNATRIVGEVRQNLGELSKASEQIFSVGKDIASLQEILRAPKLRGVIGEFLLGELLAQILPSKHFQLQHRFKSGEVVDAVIRLGNYLVPIDSKYPLENFKRILESHTEEERKPAKRKFMSDVKKTC